MTAAEKNVTAEDAISAILECAEPITDVAHTRRIFHLLYLCALGSPDMDAWPAEKRTSAYEQMMWLLDLNDRVAQVAEQLENGFIAQFPDE